MKEDVTLATVCKGEIEAEFQAHLRTIALSAADEDLDGEARTITIQIKVKPDCDGVMLFEGKTGLKLPSKVLKGNALIEGSRVVTQKRDEDELSDRVRSLYS